jgi:hypothetical protein
MIDTNHVNNLPYSPFSPNKNIRGEELYHEAIEDSNPENWFKVAQHYDITFTGLWGDIIFAGIEFGSPEFHSLDELSIAKSFGKSSFCIFEDEERKLFPKKIFCYRESFLMSCEFYLTVLQIDSNHYEANLRLASALTAALQHIPSVKYWKKCIAINESRTLTVLKADASMGKFNRRISNQLILAEIEGFEAKTHHIQHNFKFFKQLEESTKLLNSSNYITQLIKEFGVPFSDRVSVPNLFNPFFMEENQSYVISKEFESYGSNAVIIPEGGGFKILNKHMLGIYDAITFDQDGIEIGAAIINALYLQEKKVGLTMKSHSF